MCNVSIFKYIIYYINSEMIKQFLYFFNCTPPIWNENFPAVNLLWIKKLYKFIILTVSKLLTSDLPRGFVPQAPSPRPVLGPLGDLQQPQAPHFCTHPDPSNNYCLRSCFEAIAHRSRTSQLHLLGTETIWGRSVPKNNNKTTHSAWITHTKPSDCFWVRG